jgi:bifunctional DNase/RNase
MSDWPAGGLPLSVLMCQYRECTMIRVNVDNIFFSNRGFVVLLQSVDDKRTLPIMIGAQEAQAIAVHIGNVAVPRPYTHDLFKTVLKLVGCHLERIEVCNFKDDTFYGRLYINHNGTLHDIDCRPSDAIALALRFKAPIFVADAVMEEAGVIINADQRTDSPSSSVNGNKGEQTVDQNVLTENLTPVEILQRQLKQAITREQYEEAARIRDELKRINPSN